MKWQVRITGKPDCLRRAVNYFSKDDDGFEIIKIDNQFYIEKEVDTHKKEAVFREAEKIIPLINGVLRIINNEKANIRLTNVKLVNKVNEDGNRGIGTAIIDNTGSLSTNVKIMISSRDGTMEEYPKDDIKQYYAIGKKDDSVNKVLQLSNNLDSWDNLWRIHEIIEADTNGYKKLDQWGDRLKDQVNLFGHTVNHQDAIGLKARHMTSNREPPEKPMTLSEAQHMIRKIITFWIKSK